MARNDNPQLPSSIEEACRFRRLLLDKTVQISSLTGLTIGEVLERIEYTCDLDECSVEAFVAFDENTPVQS